MVLPCYRDEKNCFRGRNGFLSFPGKLGTLLPVVQKNGLACEVELQRFFRPYDVCVLLSLTRSLLQLSCPVALVFVSFSSVYGRPSLPSYETVHDR